MLSPYGLAIKLLDPFDWASCNTFWFLSLEASVLILTVLVAYSKPLTACVFVVLLGFSLVQWSIALGMKDEIRRFFDDLREHLGMRKSDSLESIIGLSPSQLTDFCQRRLHTLAYYLEEIEPRTTPVDQERIDAKTKFDRAFGFFRHHNLIPDTGKGRYFTQRKQPEK